jgi:predicted amino acid-binding ACT domain protein
VFQEFERTIPLPRYEVKYTERGTTPYRRPPYSFVADGFIAMGDAACLTKPHAGEGVTSSMVQAEIAADEVEKALASGGPLTRERLWGINKRYVDAQGRTYAGMLATLIGAVSSSAAENDFFFRKDVVFSKKSFENMGDDKPLSILVKKSAYYIRFRVQDQPGIIAKLAGILAAKKISLDAVLQEPGQNPKDLPFVMTVEPTTEQSIREALDEMSKLEFLKEAPLALPLEPGL